MPSLHNGGLRPLLLLVLLIVAWGVCWPAIKVGVFTVPPIWYACLRYVIVTPP